MRILVDENIPLMTVRELINIGHDVLDIRGTTDQGMTDSDLWERAQREERLLITTDKGFARYRHTHNHGILIIRLRQPNRFKIHKRVMQAISSKDPEDWCDLLVVMRDKIQIIYRHQSRVEKDIS